MREPFFSQICNDKGDSGLSFLMPSRTRSCKNLAVVTDSVAGVSGSALASILVLASHLGKTTQHEASTLFNTQENCQPTEKRTHAVREKVRNQKQRRRAARQRCFTKKSVRSGEVSSAACQNAGHHSAAHFQRGLTAIPIPGPLLTPLPYCQKAA